MSEPIADFRSDTVTTPTPAMREAMAAAEVGDDVLGADPTVAALQEEAAAALGHETALFVPSGTMANAIALCLHAKRGEEVLLEEASHTYIWEGGGLSWLSGATPRPIPSDRGQIDPEVVRAHVRADNDHFPRTRLLSVENTHNMHGGTVLPVARMRELRAVCDEIGIGLHLDGARLFNAAAATGEPASAWGGLADTVSVCLSKALGAPVGSVLAGSAAAMKEARRIRKVLGGGMRQSGVIAAAARIALAEGPAKLVADHARATRFATSVREYAASLPAPDAVRVGEPETNMVFVSLPNHTAAYSGIVEELRAQGILVIAIPDRGFRFVTHHQVDDAMVDRAIAAFTAAIGRTVGAA